MKPALLLVDLQNDYLGVTGLQPNAGALVAGVARLLGACRQARIPIIHIWTTVAPGGDGAMPHWRELGVSRCVSGTHGHATPEPLRPLAGELTVHKRFYSGFHTGALESHLAGLQRDTLIDTLIVAGVHLHGCVRATVLDAYQRGYRVCVADDAVASYDPVHAADTRRFLAERTIRFQSVDACIAALSPPARASIAAPRTLPAAIADAAISDKALPALLHRAPGAHDTVLWSVPACSRALVAEVTRSAKRAWTAWRQTSVAHRVEVLQRLAHLLADEHEPLARQMAVEVGKPISEARAEVTRGIDIVAAVTARAEQATGDWISSGNGQYRRCPLGLVAMITPWNNPLAIPVGKLAPALLFGNTVVWKPAIPGSALAVALMGLIERAGCPPGVVNLVLGDKDTAVSVMSDERVDGVTLSGSSEAGFSAHAICARRRVPLQAELGGNNAAIVWSDTDLDAAARAITSGAFGFAGQRCTANRRVIVDADCYDRFVSALCERAGAMIWSDPMRDQTEIGPVVSVAKRRAIAALIERSSRAATTLYIHDHPSQLDERERREGAYHAPVILACDDPDHELVRDESFAPILVVQRASSWEHALAACNRVGQGLVAALFSASADRRRDFAGTAQAGILKFDQATAGAGVDLPFSGWKQSGVGPPEHGPGNREFYTRMQAAYGLL